MNRSVAVIGAGPAGLNVARWLKREGFEPVLFEQGERIGGQWTGDPRYSGVWPSMVTNTERLMSEFSDLAHANDTPLYPSNQAMCAYLQCYAETFDLVARTRLRTRVVALDRAAGGAWSVHSIGPDGVSREETFPFVVVASGRFNRPSLPQVPGLDTFSGSSGVAHTFSYRGAERYRDQRVFVGGCAVSALEIASDLAMQGAARVVTGNRRQRYVLPKIAAGIPTGQLLHTRLAAFARESLTPDAVAAELKKLILRVGGGVEQYGGRKPDENAMLAGLTQCQYYLSLVAEGKIAVSPWIASIDGQTITFTDGHAEQFDGLIFGTGFDLHVPFLADSLRKTLAVDAQHIDLYDFTFSPALPGLAFAGLFQVAGPYLPPIEMQGRWIAYAWSGARPLPSRQEMEHEIGEYRVRRGQPQVSPMSMLMLRFARNAGVEPELSHWPDLAETLLFGPLSPASFRLSGRDALADAPARIVAAANAHGPISDERRKENLALLRAVAAARTDVSLGDVGTRLQ